MKAFGSATAKRTIVYSNSAGIGKLDAGPMKKAELQSDIQTTTRYVSKEGRKRFCGNENLKQTQFLEANEYIWDSGSQHQRYVWGKSS